MKGFVNYILFKDELEKYNKEKNDIYSLNNDERISRLLKKYDDLYKHFKKIKSMENGKFTRINQTEEDLMNEITSKLKDIYFNKMSSILSSNSIETCESCIRGFLSDLKEYKSKYFNGIIQSFITDIERVLANINLIYNNYNSNLINYTNYKNKLSKSSNEYQDPLYDEVKKFALETGKISAALIQRKFRLGYNRANRMIDLLEENGVIGGANGSKPRDVLSSNSAKEKRVVISNINDLLNNNYLIKPSEIDYFSKTFGDDYSENVKKFYNRLGINIDYNSDINIDFSKMNNSLFTNSEPNDPNSLVNKILENSTPNKVKLLLIDFSKINMSEYNGIPHLLAPVITDYNKSTIALKKIIEEMEHRYDLFLEERVKNILSYNEKNLRIKLPYIIVVINDFYELLKVNNVKDIISNILLNCKNAGIIIMAFSKFKKKNIQLFMLEDLLKIYSNYSDDYIEGKMNKTISSIDNVDNNMDGFEFEKYAGDLLKSNGFSKVEVTQSSNDYGVDIIAFKDDIKYAIQCKKYSSPVGIKAVQEVIGSKSMNGCHVGVVLTNNTFTKSAKELAEKNNVLLWDRKKLEELINNYVDNK